MAIFNGKKSSCFESEFMVTLLLVFNLIVEIVKMEFHKLLSLTSFLIIFNLSTVSAQEPDLPADIKPEPREIKPKEPDTDALFFGGGGGGDPTEDIQSSIIDVLKPELTFEYDASSSAGDHFNPSTGSITFATADISIPGNSNIPVTLKRWIPSSDMDTGGPADWKWDIPFIVGNYLDVKPGHSDTGWDWGTSNWHTGNNCNGSASTVYSPKDEKIAANTYWSGKKLHIPGETSDVFLTSSSGVQITKSNYKISACINNTGGEQGIKVKGPNGLTYTFNKIKKYFNGKATFKNPAVWTKILMVTKIEDRFGNYVNYNYQGDDLTSISSSDGRNITIAYQSVTINGVVKKRPTTATTNGRVWRYFYSGSGLGVLDTVELPDGKEWSYNNVDVVAFRPDGLGNVVTKIRSYSPQRAPGCGVPTTTYNASVTTPYGLTVNYTFKPINVSRSNVDPSIFHDPYADISYSRNMHCNIDMAITNRTISGAGVASFNWDYTYSQNTGNYDLTWLNSLLTGPFTLSTPVGGFPSVVNSTSNSQHFRTTTVESDDEKIIYYVDRKFQSNTEGMVVAVDYIDANTNNLLKREEKSYVKGALVGANWFYCPCGGNNSPANSVNLNQTSYQINLSQTTTKSYLASNVNTFDTYKTSYDNYGVYGFPEYTYEYNDLNGSALSTKKRATKQTYLHDTQNWLIGLPRMTYLSTNGNGYVAISETQYHSATGSYKSLPKKQLSFGRWYKYNETYHISGNQAGLPNKVSYNGTNRWMYFSNYKRGIAQTIRTPKSLSTSSQYAYRVVDDNGWVEKQTDFMGYCTEYDYDDVGRMTLIDPCDTRWANTTISYAETSGSDGLSYVQSGMFKQTVTTGNYQKTHYFDSMLRSILTKEWDTTLASTARYTRASYDPYSRPIYTSFAASNSNTPYGVNNQYDSLGRILNADDNTTTGSVSYSYLTNNQVQINDNKGNTTTTTYQAYGSPEQSMATTIASPHSVTTAMAYNIYGNMSSVIQGGQTEYRVYDAYQQLCKTVRADVGRTAYQHDALGKLLWQASGNSVSTSTTACDTVVDAQDKASFTFDNLGNVKTINFGDTSPDKTYVYDKNSRLETLTAGSVVTDYEYNSANMIEKEILNIDGESFILDYVYDNIGNLTHTIYPSDTTISYAPNALGQAKQAGSYATNALYHPNGMVKSHNYLNGFIHTSTQKTSGLPNTFYDKKNTTYALNHGFTYDANNNVTFLDDKVSNAYDLSLAYDGLDRLNTITDSYLGAGDVNYDAMGNITYYKLGSQTINYVYNSNKQLDYTTGSKSYSFDYDDKGNVTDNGSRSFIYNAANQMVDSDGYQYTYDGNNKRVKEEGSNSTASYSFYASNGKLMYRKVNGQHLDYYYLSGKLVANKKSSTVTYLHSDYLGSTAAESNSAGTVTRMHYQPFGESIEAPKDDVGYTGHKFDTDLGLSYMQARYYDPVIGRFYSNDPVDVMEHLIGEAGVQGFNRYAYANNNPYKYTDPDGKSGVLISPKFTPRVSPVAQGVRQAINTSQPKTNPVQQQTQKIAQQMRDTVKNSKPEVKQPSLKETMKGASDTTGGFFTNLVKQLIKHADDFAGGNGSVNTTSPDASSSAEMSDDTKRVIGQAQILMAPPVPPQELTKLEAI
jgi:RHS repeat-associated protein